MLNLYAFGFGAPIEWIVVGVVALLLLGPKKLPEFARGVGKSIGELKKGLDESKESFNASMATPAEQPATTVETKPVAAEAETAAKK